MLKTAYQIGFELAMEEGNADQLLKEAQELGVDLEKIGQGGLRAAWGALRGFGKNLWSGTKAMKEGLGVLPGGFKSRLSSAWQALTPVEQQALKMTGVGLGGLTAGRMLFGGGGNPPPPPPQQSWLSSLTG